MKIPIFIICWFLFIQPIALKGMDANPILSENYFILNIQLQKAIETGDTELIAFYLSQGGNVERTIKSRRASLLVHACRHNNPEISKLLLEAHANPNSTDKAGETPLICVSDEKICKMLLDAKAEVHATDVHGYTPLMCASNEYICKMLLNAGALVNASNYSGGTPLMQTFDGKITKLLLDAGADVNVRNDEGETALFTCCEIIDDDPIIEKDKKIERYRLLLDARADINAQCNYGHTVLIEEIYQGNERICEFLLSCRASVHIKANNGLTPLLAAAQSRNKAICKTLVSHHKELDRGLIAALHYLKHIKNPFLRFLYQERETLLRPHLQHGTLAAQLQQKNDDDKRPYYLFHLNCLKPKEFQNSDDDSADDSEDGKKESSSRKNEMWGHPWDVEKIWRWTLPAYPDQNSE